MRADDVAKVLLVRAVEESDPLATTSPEADAAASAEAPEGGERGWLLRRAEHRLAHEFAGRRPLLRLTSVPHAPLLFFALPFALGLVSNWFGPTSHIHVLYNPIAVLVAWNLALYALLALAPFAGRRLHARVPAPDLSLPSLPRPAIEARGPGGVRGWLMRRAAPSLFFRVRRDASDATTKAAGAGKLARRFWRHWVDVAGALPLVRLRRILHGAAAALAIGAVAGMFVRGVFFEYAMVWRSTFVRDPEAVATALRVVLGPAAWLAGKPQPDVALAERMMSAEGVPAALWIGLWAITATAVVVLPRLLLAGVATWRRRRLERNLALPLEDEYFDGLLAGVRRAEIERIEAEIDGDVRAEIARLVERVADFTCVKLYDERLVPALRAFRATGGSIESLEREMETACRAFQPELDVELDRARGDLETGLRAAIVRTLGKSLVEWPDHGVAVGAGDLPVGDLGGAVGREVSNAVGAAVSTGVALVTATIAGGFGHHLGAALLVTLLHVTGPVGFLLGGAGGLAVAGAGWWLGRDRLASGMRGLPLPRAVARLALRDSALAKLVADGRAQCGAAVREKLGLELAPLAPRLAAEIWAKLRPVLPAAKGGAAR